MIDARLMRLKPLALIVGGVLSMSPLLAQHSSDPTDTANFPVYARMMQDPNVRFADVQRAFEIYWKDREIQRGSGYKPFKRWEYMMETRLDPDGTLPAPDATFNAFQEYMASYSASGLAESVAGDWKELGPVTQPTQGNNQPTGMGRVNCVAFHPTNSQHIYVGAPAGGFWFSHDAGQSWETTTDGLPSLGVSAIVIDHTNPNRIFIGTGDRDAGDAPGMGVFVSEDAGQTWAQSNNGMGSPTVGAMLMNPFDNNQLFAATSNGIFKSTDGGQSWTQTSNSGNFKDIRFMPGNTNIMYAEATGEFYRSDNNGNSWTEINTIPPSSRLVIGVTPANPNYVYCLLSQGSSFLAVYRSEDAGLTWTMQANSPNLLGWASDGGDTGGQAWYDLCIAVDPSDADVVYTGGVNIWKSTNGGQDWNIVSHWVGSGAPVVHADHHAMAWNPHDDNLYVGNDGGLHHTGNGGQSWNELSSGLVISQIYRMGQSFTDQGLVINGYQDNGSSIYDDGNWRHEIGADGMECAIDYTDPGYIYGSIYFGNIRRSTNRGLDFSTIASFGTGGITEQGAWVTPYMLHSENPNVMFIGYKNVWRSRNVKSGDPVFEPISNNLGGNNSQDIRDLHQSRANSDIFYMSRSDGRMFRSDNINDESPDWTEITGTLPFGGTVLDIESDHRDENRVYIILAGLIFESDDKGETWNQLSGNLPSVTKNCLAFDEYSNGGLYLGTDAGVYYRDETIGDWILFNDGMPVSVVVTELEFAYHPDDISQSKVRASTYGRGLWESPLFDDGTTAPNADFKLSATASDLCDNKPIQFVDYSAYGPTSWTWTFSPSTVTYMNGTNENSASPEVLFDEPGSYDVTLTVSNANGTESISRPGLVTISAGADFPFFEDFEAFNLCAPGGLGSCNVPCETTNGWVNVNDGSDDYDWTTFSGPTKFFTDKTGPQRDYNPGTEEGHYMYVESNGCMGLEAQLESPCISLEEAQFPELRFGFHMTSPIGVGQLSVDIFSDGAWTNDFIPAKTEDFGQVWEPALADLEPYKGKLVKFRFRATSANNSINDIGLDDIQVKEKYAAGILESEVLQGVKIYPNPNSGQFFLEWEGSDADLLDVRITNNLGQQLWVDQLQGTGAAQTVSIEPTTLPAGLYFVQLNAGAHTEVIRMVVDR